MTVSDTLDTLYSDLIGGKVDDIRARFPFLCPAVFPRRLYMTRLSAKYTKHFDEETSRQANCIIVSVTVEENLKRDVAE